MRNLHKKVQIGCLLFYNQGMTNIDHPIKIIIWIGGLDQTVTNPNRYGPNQTGPSITPSVTQPRFLCLEIVALRKIARALALRGNAQARRQSCACWSASLSFIRSPDKLVSPRRKIKRPYQWGSAKARWMVVVDVILSIAWRRAKPDRFAQRNLSSYV